MNVHVNREFARSQEHPKKKPMCIGSIAVQEGTLSHLQVFISMES